MLFGDSSVVSYLVGSLSFIVIHPEPFWVGWDINLNNNNNNNNNTVQLAPETTFQRLIHIVK